MEQQRYAVMNCAEMIFIIFNFCDALEMERITSSAAPEMHWGNIGQKGFWKNVYLVFDTP